MELKNFFKKTTKTNVDYQYWVMPIGFDTAFVERINSIINLSREGARSYRLHTPNCDKPIDILLINYDNPLSLAQKNALLNSSCPNAVVVTVSQGPIASQPEYHLRGLVTASRLLSILDRLPLTKGAAPETKPLITTPSQPTEAPITPTASSLTPAPQPVVAQPIAPAPPVIQPRTTPPPSLPIINTNTSGYKALVVDDSVAIQVSLETETAGHRQNHYN